jgi:hypothetical protein
MAAMSLCIGQVADDLTREGSKWWMTQQEQMAATASDKIRQWQATKEEVRGGGGRIYN